jgi:hypothetical protein
LGQDKPTGEYESCNSLQASRRTEHKIDNEFCKHLKRRCGRQRFWPPSSPDCNPVDYFVWGVTELKVYAAPHNKTEDLVKKIKEVMGYLDKHTVAKACRRFRSRIQAVVAADGDFIE